MGGNGDFADTGEQVVSITGASAAPVSTNITIPQGVITGTARMRVAVARSST